MRVIWLWNTHLCASRWVIVNIRILRRERRRIVLHKCEARKPCEHSVFEASQSNRTRKKTGILFLLSIRVNEKDGARCILNTRILTSKPCWSHNRQLCDSLSRASENPCILCFSNFNENFISPGSLTRGRKGLIEQINAWEIDLSFHVPERLLVPVARLLPIIWMIHFV